MPKRAAINERSAVKRSLRTIIPAMVLFALGFALVSIYIGMDRVITPMAQIGWVLVLALLGLSLVNYGLRTLRWMIFNRNLSIPISPLDALITYFCGFALQMTPMKAGEALRLWLIAKRYQIGYQRLVPLLLVDKLYDSIGLYLMAVIGSLSFVDYQTLFYIVGILLVIKIFLFLNPKYLYSTIGLFFRLTLRKKKRFWAGARASFRGAEKLLTWKVFIPSIILTIVGWLAEIYAFSKILTAMQSTISMAKLGFIFTFSTGTGAITLSPGGLGGVELTMQKLLTVLDVPEGVALASVLIIRLTTLWFAVILGMLILPIALRRAKNPVTIIPHLSGR